MYHPYLNISERTIPMVISEGLLHEAACAATLKSLWYQAQLLQALSLPRLVSALSTLCAHWLPISEQTDCLTTRISTDLVLQYSWLYDLNSVICSLLTTADKAPFVCGGVMFDRKRCSSCAHGYGLSMRQSRYLMRIGLQTWKWVTLKVHFSWQGFSGICLANGITASSL